MNIFDSAEYAASLSECKKLKVGAALSVKGEVVAVGYNHAYDEPCSCSMDKENPMVRHAEIACLEHYELLHNDYAEMACTYICCLKCCEYILKKGINVLYYRDHRNEPEKQRGINFLKSNGVEVRHEWSV